MSEKKGKFDAKTLPTTPTAAGNIKIDFVNYDVLNPKPNSWVMLKPGDILVSQSGTTRLILKKDWQEGHVECLRLTYEKSQENSEACLDIENIEINSSDFERLAFSLRGVVKKSNDQTQYEYCAEHFSKTVRVNILSLLGYGNVGADIHHFLQQSKITKKTERLSLSFKFDHSSGRLLEMLSESYAIASKDSEATQELLSFTWAKNLQKNIFLISDFHYASGSFAAILETVRISAEIANTFSWVHAKWLDFG